MKKEIHKKSEVMTVNGARKSRFDRLVELCKRGLSLWDEGLEETISAFRPGAGALSPSLDKGVRLTLSFSMVFPYLAAATAALWMLLAAPAPAYADIPQLINFQGRLTDANNNPRSGSFTLKFRIFNALSGGTALWPSGATENQTVTVTNGIFSVKLGAVTPIPYSVFSSFPAYLEITVGGAPDETLSPRQQLLSAPYAFSAATLMGNGSDSFVSTSPVSQTIAGVKTFSSHPRISVYSAPTASTEYTPKQYVDALTSGGANAAVLIGTQTFSGRNTFNNPVGLGTTGASSALDVFNGSITVRGTNAGLQIRGMAAGFVKTDASGNFSGGNSIADGDILSTITRDAEWDSIAEINAATTDADIIATNSTWSGGDLAGTGLAATVNNDSHSHTATTVSGLGVTDFTSSNISQWTNDSGYVTAAGTLTGLIQSSAGGISYITGGNVGIGTSSPSSKFDVLNGSITVRGTNAGLAVGTSFRVNSSGSLSGASGNISQWTNDSGYLTNISESDPQVGANTANFVSKWNGSALVAGTIFDNGNIGIGTASPSTLLHAFGNSASRIKINIQNSNTTSKSAELAMSANSAAGWAVGTDSAQNGTDDFYIWGGGSGNFRLQVNSSGNVGINTSSPGGRLEIWGAQTDTSTTFDGLLRFGASNGTIGHFYRDYNGTNSYLGLESFNVGNTVKTPLVFQEYGGNVGIGTINPSGALEINGQYGSNVVVHSGTAGSTETIDWSQGNVHHITLDVNCTLTFSNGLSGRKYILIIKQDASGGNTLTWPAAVRWSGGSAPSNTTTASKTDYFGFVYNSVDSKYDGVAKKLNF